MKVKRPAVDEIKGYLRPALIERIRELYSVDEEFRLINRGIAEPLDPEYLEYRSVVDDLVEFYKQTVDNTHANGSSAH
jgi:hypothetical protein